MSHCYYGSTVFIQNTKKNMQIILNKFKSKSPMVFRLHLEIADQLLRPGGHGLRSLDIGHRQSVTLYWIYSV